MAFPARQTTTTLEEFTAGFDRCFLRVYAYVVRRVNDREICERIVSEVLAENVELLVEPGDEREQAAKLKATSDRLIRAIESEAAPAHLYGPHENTEAQRRIDHGKQS